VRSTPRFDDKGVPLEEHSACGDYPVIYWGPKRAVGVLFGHVPPESGRCQPSDCHSQSDSPAEKGAVLTGCRPASASIFGFMLSYRPDRRMYPITSIARQKPHAGLWRVIFAQHSVRAAFYRWNNDKRNQQTIITPAAKRMSFRPFTFLRSSDGDCRAI